MKTFLILILFFNTYLLSFGGISLNEIVENRWSVKYYIVPKATTTFKAIDWDELEYQYSFSIELSAHVFISSDLGKISIHIINTAANVKDQVTILGASSGELAPKGLNENSDYRYAIVIVDSKKNRIHSLYINQVKPLGILNGLPVILNDAIYSKLVAKLESIAQTISVSDAEQK
jgi:hypothetical protein